MQFCLAPFRLQNPASGGPQNPKPKAQPLREVRNPKPIPCGSSETRNPKPVPPVPAARGRFIGRTLRSKRAPGRWDAGLNLCSIKDAAYSILEWIYCVLIEQNSVHKNIIATQGAVRGLETGRATQDRRSFQRPLLLLQRLQLLLPSLLLLLLALSFQKAS